MNPDPPPADAPRSEYTRRLDAARALAARQSRRDRRLADARLALFAAGGVLAWLAWGAGRVSAWWLAAPLAGFAALVVAHDRVGRAIRRAGRLSAFYERGLACLDDRWTGLGEPGAKFRDAEHPYADDLDLFGPGSLFERLCTARTRAGEETLAAWLLGPAPPGEVRARHEAVAELRPRLDLREDLALLGGDVRGGASFDGLAEWGAGPRRLDSRAARVAAAALASLAASALVGWALFEAGLRPLLAVLAVEAAVGLGYLRRVRAVLRAVERRADDLGLLADLLARLERERFAAPRLRRLGEALATSGRPASRQIARLRRLVELLDARRNILFAPLAPALLWGTQIAFAVEAWRAANGRAIAGWLEAIGQIEALAALAAFAYESPDARFPELVEGRGAVFEAEAVGHPLLPGAGCVRNDVRLGGELRVLIVSGSNMSGKSTLLRAVGVNAVLAQAGAPVRARRLRLSPLAVGATLRVQDSLQAGRSRFYAEILRLRRLVDLAGGPIPLLFLLDEVLHGTNSHDRRRGAEAIVRGLVDRGAVGLVTTHDLALADVADRLAPRAANVHFEDRLDDGVMTFDYRMRPGVVQHSNALALMRAVGLDV